MKKILFFTMALLGVLGGNTTLHAAAAAQAEGKRSADDDQLDDNQADFRAEVAAMTLDQKNKELFDAVASDYPEEVKILLAAGVDKDAKNKKGETPFYKALKRGGRSIAILLDAGANPEIHPEGEFDALCTAIRYGRNDALKKMLDAGMSANHKHYGRFSDTPLRSALGCLNGHDGCLDTVVTLLNAGADADWLDKDQKECLMRVAFQAIGNYGVSVIEKVLRLGVSLEKIEEGKKTGAFFEAVRQGNLYIAQVLLNSGINFSKKRKKFYNECDYEDDSSEMQFFREHADDTPLIFAEKIGSVEIVKAIKQKQLFDAIEKNDLPSLQIVLEKGADIHSRDVRGLTPLHVAAQVGNTQATQELLKAGADIYAVDRFGNMPFGSAAYKMNTVLGNANYVSVRGSYEKFAPLKRKKEKYPHLLYMDFLDQRVRTPAIEKEAEKYQSVMQILLDAELMQAANEHNQAMTRSLIAGPEYLGNRRMQPTREAIQKALGKAESFGERLVESKKIKNQKVIELLTGSLQK